MKFAWKNFPGIPLTRFRELIFLLLVIMKFIWKIFPKSDIKKNPGNFFQETLWMTTLFLEIFSRIWQYGLNIPVSSWTVLNTVISSFSIDTFLSVLTNIFVLTFVDIITWVTFFLISIATGTDITAKRVHTVLKNSFKIEWNAPDPLGQRTTVLKNLRFDPSIKKA